MTCSLHSLTCFQFYVELSNPYGLLTPQAAGLTLFRAR
jgi:hypothetical protein